jgi:hypothetical protein
MILLLVLIVIVCAVFGSVMDRQSTMKSKSWRWAQVKFLLTELGYV